MIESHTEKFCIGNTLEPGTKVILDLLRIFLIGCVVLGHGFYAYGLTIFRNDEYFPAIQSLAVVGIFWISGFLTAYQIRDRKDNYKISSFILHKAKRVIPEYWACILFIIAIDKLHIYLSPDKYSFYDTFNIKTCVGNCFMLHGWIEGIGYFFEPLGSARPLWTMTVQWWFWVSVATVFMLRKEIIKKYDILLLLFVLVICFRVVGTFAIIMTLGFAGFYIYKKIPWKTALFFLGIAAVVFALYGHFLGGAYTNEMFLLVATMLTCLVATFKGINVYPWKVLRTIGAMTFEVYLIHYSINVFVMDCVTGVGDKVRLVIAIILSCVFAFCIYYSVDLIKKKYKHCFLENGKTEANI